MGVGVPGPCPATVTLTLGADDCSPTRRRRASSPAWIEALNDVLIILFFSCFGVNRAAILFSRLLTENGVSGICPEQAGA